MGKIKTRLFHQGKKWYLPAFLLLSLCLIQGQAGAFSVTVVDHQGKQIEGGFRWLLEEDNTNLTIPGSAVSNSISLDIHKGHAPVISKGHSAGSSAAIPFPTSPNAISFPSYRIPGIR